jgi:Ring finger domain
VANTDSCVIAVLHRPLDSWTSIRRMVFAPVFKPVVDVITEEEFNALPVIIYSDKGTCIEADCYLTDIEETGSANGSADDADDGDTTDVAASIENESVAVVTGTKCAHDSSDTVTLSSTANQPAQEEAKPQPKPDTTCFKPPCEYTTMSTCCCICIDDFECGERLILLPKCNHAFHPDCLLPWLTERHAFCPSCKEPLKDDSVEKSASEERESTGEASTDVEMGSSGSEDERNESS